MLTNYELGDILDSSIGILFVQCSLIMRGPMQGKALYWLQNEQGEDLLFWNEELANLNIKLITDEEFDKYLPYKD